MAEREDHPRKITLKVTVGKGKTTMKTPTSLKIRMRTKFVLK
jgi:hypothetical protein